MVITHKIFTLLLSKRENPTVGGFRFADYTMDSV